MMRAFRDTELGEDWVEWEACEVHPAGGCGDSCRQVEGYNDCTLCHLPRMDVRPPLPRKLEARPASLAARIAFSNFTIRSLVR